MSERISECCGWHETEFYPEEYGICPKCKDHCIFIDECPHDEHDHGICIDCGKDIHVDLEGRADSIYENKND